MRQKAENTVIRGGMRSYRQRQAEEAARRMSMAAERTADGAQAPPAAQTREPAPVAHSGRRPKKMTMLTLMIAVHVVVIAGLIGYQLIEKGAKATEDYRAGPPPSSIPDHTSTTPADSTAAVPTAAIFPESTPDALPREATTHVVEGAETWASIAHHYGITSERLQRANPQVDGLSVGLSLDIPATETVVAAAELEGEAELPKEISTQPAPGAGQKAFEINDDNRGFSSLDPLPRNRELRVISPRREDTIPKARIVDPIVNSELPYSPAPAETAEPQSPPAEESIGEPIPKARIITEQPEAKPVRRTMGSAQAAVDIRKHTVRRGDTLYGVAGKLGISVERLKSINGLNSDSIQPGQTLVGAK